MGEREKAVDSRIEREGESSSGEYERDQAVVNMKEIN